MKNVTARVKVVSSGELGAMRLVGLRGRRGTVTERILSDGERLIGYMVLLEEPFQGEYLWFIPEDAVEDAEDN